MTKRDKTKWKKALLQTADRYLMKNMGNPASCVLCAATPTCDACIYGILFDKRCYEIGPQFNAGFNCFSFVSERKTSLARRRWILRTVIPKLEKL